ncbi:ABC transporter permease subunit [Cohnella sp. CFH 77786]|uniref:carbohydrate ABC transporter permease n=1 Tax=Cohnella sp. CFH 77786 TaxID=2662265 RepID=UPI001C60C760|nr:sugar ABC transporter permease [Cohnella sp. CFH 77786]MBW5445736.1 ABC transporter permease subunit [Cohnella sp. CFH 77786]
MEKLLRKKTTILFFTVPALLFYTAIVFVPILFSIYYSFFSWDAISPRKYVGLDNFVRMFTKDDVFVTSVKNMLFLTVTSIVFQQVLGFMLAVFITSRIKGKEFFKNVYFFPAVISSVAVGMLWTFIYDPGIGLLNGFLGLIGLGSLQHQWLYEPATAMWAITTVVSWQYVGYTMILYVAAIQNVPGEIFESARIDGAVGWRLVRTMTIPLVRPIIKVSTVLITIGSLKFFDLVFVMTRGGPADSTTVLALHMYSRSFSQLEYGYGDALAVVLLAMCLAATMIIHAIFRKSEVEY